jgi:hypothetical protein
VLFYADIAVMAETLMYFARSADGSVVDVTEVPRGLACECLCLGCNAPLLAKQGKVNAWHFGHSSGASRRACAETALHLAGKELLHELTEIRVPPVSYAMIELDVLKREHIQTVEAAASSFNFSSCSLEHTTGTRRLDALLKSSERNRLGIEILVTHKVDDQKAKDLLSLNAPVLEIDLRSWVGKPLDREILKKLLTSDAPRAIVAGAQILLELQVHSARAALEHWLASIALAIPAVLALSSRESADALRIIERIGLSASPWPRWLEWDGWLATQPIDKLPEKVFGVHHRVWQGACAEFVIARPGGRKFSVSEALDAVELVLCGTHLGVDDADASAISAFFLHLVNEGLIKSCYNDDHGWGEDWYQAETWTPRRLAAAQTALRKTAAEDEHSQIALF